jgi:hypothetical protein
MISRATSPDLLNRIANDPSVRPFVDYRRVGEPLDFSAAFPARQTGIVVLTNGADAAGIFVLTADRDWQAHILFAASCRGARAIAAWRGMLAWLKPYADVVWGAIPLRNKRARWFARHSGARHAGFDHYETEGPVELLRVEL